ncbi:MAG: S41 family peptidase [Blastocatellia bacterium]
MSAKIRIAIVMLSAGVAFYAIAGGFPWDRGATAKGNQWAQLRIFDEVLYRISKDYVDEPDMERVRTGALRGLADGLDAYSAYLTPAQVAGYVPVEHGVHAVGGMALSKYGGYVYVVSCWKGSPADRSGIATGDIIEYIGKAPTRDMSLYDAEMLLTDVSNGPHDVKLFRAGQSFTVTFTNGPVVAPPVESKMLEPGVGYLNVLALTSGRAVEVRGAIDQLTAKGMKRLVLDLRGCATGTMEEGASVANIFVESGVLGRKIGRGGAEGVAIEAQASLVAFRGPLTVLVDPSSAGAAEVIASAVATSKRGDVVGERTFGAGVELELFKLRDGGAMLITVAKYAPASGKPFIDEGVMPTVEVKRAVPEIVVPEDQDEDEPATPEDKPVVKPAPKPAATEDVQLKKALEILKGVDAAAARAA